MPETVQKYSEGQERDERGRFGSGGGIPGGAFAESGAGSFPADPTLAAGSQYAPEDWQTPAPTIDAAASTVFPDPNLSASEVTTVLAYTSEGEYESINGALRGESGDLRDVPLGGGGWTPDQPMFPMTDAVKSEVDAIDHAISQSEIPPGVTLYREVESSVVDDFIAKGMLAGDVYTDAGFQSTTLNESLARDFAAGDNGWVMEIHPGEGDHGLYVREGMYDPNSTYASQNEVILPRDQPLSVRSIDNETKTIVMDTARKGTSLLDVPLLTALGIGKAADVVPYQERFVVLPGQGRLQRPIGKEFDEMEQTVTFAKTDEAAQTAFGWAYVYEKADGTRVVDHSGEFIEQQDLEDAAYVFNLEFREGDEHHTEPVQAHLIESMVITPEKLEAMGMAKDAVQHGWWTGWYIPNPEVFAKVADGTYPMMSIGGAARKEIVDA